MAAEPQSQPHKSETEATTAVDDSTFEPETTTEAEQPGEEEPEIDQANVVVATPVTMYRPGDAAVTPLKGSQRRRNEEEMSKRPDWLPSDWRMETRKRSSGKSAGEIDRYFFSPTGKKLRSKAEVMRYLATEAASKSNPPDPAPGEASNSENPKNSRKKKRKVESAPQETQSGEDDASKETTEVS